MLIICRNLSFLTSLVKERAELYKEFGVKQVRHYIKYNDMVTTNSQTEISPYQTYLKHFYKYMGSN